MPYIPDFARRRLLAVGAAIAFGVPHASRGQPSAKLPRVGILTTGALPRSGENTWFDEGLAARGYVPGKNIVLEYRAAEGRLELLPKFAAELASLPVDVLVVLGPTPLRAALDAAPRIPIVMIASSSDPVGEGLVASLARPGGNLTGLTYATSPERFGKQLELLKQAAPATKRVAVWWDLDLAMYRRSWQAPLDQAARQLGLRILEPTQVLERSAVVDSIAAMKRDGANAILIAIGGPTWSYRDLVAAEAVRNRLATIAAFKEFTRAGGLLSYGPDLPALNRRGAEFVDRILKGARAGDLPIELPPTYELAINLKTASELGLALPNELLLRADEVIR